MTKFWPISLILSHKRNFSLGKNFHHLAKISSLFPDEVFPDKVFQVIRRNLRKLVNAKICTKVYIFFRKQPFQSCSVQYLFFSVIGYFKKSYMVEFNFEHGCRLKVCNYAQNYTPPYMIFGLIDLKSRYFWEHHWRDAFPFSKFSKKSNTMESIFSSNIVVCNFWGVFQEHMF